MIWLIHIILNISLRVLGPYKCRLIYRILYEIVTWQPSDLSPSSHLRLQYLKLDIEEFARTLTNNWKDLWFYNDPSLNYSTTYFILLLILFFDIAVLTSEINILVSFSHVDICSLFVAFISANQRIQNLGRMFRDYLSYRPEVHV